MSGTYPRVSILGVAVGVILPRGDGLLSRTRAMFHVPTLERVLGKWRMRSSANWMTWAQQPDTPLEIEGLEGGFMVTQVVGGMSWTEDALVLEDVTFVRWTPTVPPAAQAKSVWEDLVADQLNPDTPIRIWDHNGFLLVNGYLKDLKVEFPTYDPDGTIIQEEGTIVYERRHAGPLLRRTDG